MTGDAVACDGDISALDRGYGDNHGENSTGVDGDEDGASTCDGDSDGTHTDSAAASAETSRQLDQMLAWNSERASGLLR